VAEAHGLVRAAAADCVVSIGGGSAVGLGKALARETALPLIAVPTTYSGSEMTDIWGITDGDRKITGRDSHVAPRLVVYDPLLTHGLPANVTAPSGMNAIAHAVEALYSSSANPAASLLAADGIRRLGAALPRLVDDPGDGYARQEAFIGAHFCGRALHMTSMGLHHKLCHALGGTLNLPHALTHAVVLPHVTAYNATAAADAMAVVASSLGASHAAQGLWRLNRRLNITQTLSDLGMSEGDVDRVVDEVTATSYPNPAPVTADGVRTILARALEGDAPA
jgi:maleylacetate reductase